MKKNNKIYIFLITFVIGTLITAPSLIPTYSLDGYCSLVSSYEVYSLVFIKAGRYLTGLFYYLVGIMSINSDIISILSVLLSNILLSFSVLTIYKRVNLIIKSKKPEKIVIFIGSFLICYNPFMIECFVFEESFALCAAFLISIIAGDVLFTEKKHKFLLSYFLLLISCSLYQGMLCIYIPYAILILIIKNKDIKIKEFIKSNYVFIIKMILCYALSLCTSFVLLKIVLNVFNLNSGKFGELNIIQNFIRIFTLIKNTIHSMFNLTSTTMYYSISCLIVLCILIVSFKDIKHAYNKWIYSIILAILCVLLAFVPNIAMNSLENYTAARMTTSYGALIGFVTLISIVFIPKNRKLYLGAIIFLACIFLLYNCYNYYNDSYSSLTRYKNDEHLAERIISIINKYQDNSNYTIEEIYYYRDDNSLYYYEGKNNSFNISFASSMWAFDCAINMFSNKNYNIIELSNNDSDEIFNYEEIIDNIGYVFDENKLYVFIH